MGYKSEETRRMEEETQRILREKGVINIPPRSIRSIEELAKLSREIDGLGIGYLSKSQIKWLYSGGFEVFEKTKPLIARLLREMEKRPGMFPVNLREVSEMVQERIRERARRGEIDKEWKNVVVSPSEIDSILRFKRDPYFSKKEKTELMAEVLEEVLEEMYKEEKGKHRVEEPEVKVALEVVRKWLERFRRVRGATLTSGAKKS